MLYLKHSAAFNTLHLCRKSNAAIHIPLILSHTLQKAHLGKDYMMCTTNSIMSPLPLHTPVQQQTHFGLRHFTEASSKSCHSWGGGKWKVCVRIRGGRRAWLQFKCSDHSIQNHSGLLRTDPHTPLGPLLTHTCIIHGSWI